MNSETGREFDFTNPQDDPHLYASPPPGFAYRYDGTLVASPMTSGQTENNDIQSLPDYCYTASEYQSLDWREAEDGTIYWVSLSDTSTQVNPPCDHEKCEYRRNFPTN